MTCLCPTEIAAIVEGIGPQHRTLWRSWGNWSLIFPGLGNARMSATEPMWRVWEQSGMRVPSSLQRKPASLAEPWKWVVR